mgnify:CR=1 FL=1
MNLESFLSQTRDRLESALDEALPSPAEEPARLHAAMRHAVLGGGKRLRPALALAANQCCDGSHETAMPAAVAVELIHAYSLVHDDLPAMDDDDLRRGRPTCHVAFDEPTAIISGDALQTLAFEILGSTPAGPDAVLEMVRVLASASGHLGMAGGQAIDMGATGAKPSIEALEAMHRRKTGALIGASLALGALSAGADERTLSTLRHFGDAIGLAFQVQDDILDVEGSVEKTGKPQGSDSNQAKATYTALLGIDGAQRRLDALSSEAGQALDDMPGDTDLLRALTRFIVQRDH